MARPRYAEELAERMDRIDPGSDLPDFEPLDIRDFGPDIEFDEIDVDDYTPDNLYSDEEDAVAGGRARCGCLVENAAGRRHLRHVGRITCQAVHFEPGLADGRQRCRGGGGQRRSPPRLRQGAGRSALQGVRSPPSRNDRNVGRMPPNMAYARCDRPPPHPAVRSRGRGAGARQHRSGGVRGDHGFPPEPGSWGPDREYDREMMVRQEALYNAGRHMRYGYGEAPRGGGRRQQSGYGRAPGYPDMYYPDVYYY
ncbi:MAG: hypothetical protein Q9225_007515 [Loekoesia sp. 1 TL-2023]